MMSKEFLKRIGVFGVAIGLTASPFALAHAVDHEEAPGQEVEDVPSPETPTEEVFPSEAADPDVPLDEREDWEDPSEAQPGQAVEDVPAPDAPGAEGVNTDPDTGAPLEERDDWAEPDELERGAEAEDVPGTEVPSEEAFPGDEPDAQDDTY
ncbi:hypothetical protein [Halomonas sp. BC04]|uniref:hypothetical protein n=1 Tax=Halomonas sp. BC04 TaxID=1403540 RepID=UPI0003ED727C|nr:hypothetical protein [Halomonas sp. BC04]EWG99765.1 hypothetical protein Q427_23180 [Halomonas sp. BC04]